MPREVSSPVTRGRDGQARLDLGAKAPKGRAGRSPGRVTKVNPKGPTSAQWAAMAGAMHNALERLRTFRSTMRALKPVSQASILNWKAVMEHYGPYAVCMDESERAALLGEVEAAANILRVGLKARVNRETIHENKGPER